MKRITVLSTHTNTLPQTVSHTYTHTHTHTHTHTRHGDKYALKNKNCSDQHRIANIVNPV